MTLKSLAHRKMHTGFGPEAAEKGPAQQTGTSSATYRYT